eukprot:s2657_g4.t1
MTGSLYLCRGPNQKKGKMSGRKWLPKKPQAKELPKSHGQEKPEPVVEPATADTEMPMVEEVPQEAEGVDIGMDVGKLCKALACVYSSFIEVETGTGKQDTVSRFHSKVAPGIGIEQYLTRLAKYFQCHESCLLLALVYIDRAVKMNPVVVVNNFTIHRLLAVATVVAAKIQDDLFFSNAHYARVCGLTLRELNSLEVYFTSLLRWKLHVPVTEYREYLNMVKRARSVSPWCGADMSGCHCSDPGSEEDPDAGILEPPSDQEDPDFLMARELKYHLELVSPIVGMARKTNLCKCWEPEIAPPGEVIALRDKSLKLEDTMGNLCTEVEWWLQDEASQNRYDAVHTNWEKLLAVWDHLLRFHIEDLLDAGFDSDTVKDAFSLTLGPLVRGKASTSASSTPQPPLAPPMVSSAAKSLPVRTGSLQAGTGTPQPPGPAQLAGTRPILLPAARTPPQANTSFTSPAVALTPAPAMPVFNATQAGPVRCTIGAVGERVHNVQTAQTEASNRGEGLRLSPRVPTPVQGAQQSYVYVGVPGGLQAASSTATQARQSLGRRMWKSGNGKAQAMPARLLSLDNLSIRITSMLPSPPFKAFQSR